MQTCMSSVCSITSKTWQAPLDLEAWDFYVAATADMDVILGEQKTATLAALKKRLPLRATGYTGLAMAIFDTYRSIGGME